MKLLHTVNVFYYALCIQFAFGYLQFVAAINSSSLPSEAACDIDYESSGSGNDSCIGYKEHTPTASEMVHCQCNNTYLMVDRNFLLKWLDIAEDHSISKLSIAAHNLKIDTDYLQVGGNNN